jgi:hypothetical protein
MTVAEIILIVRNRLSTLGQQRSHAVAIGDVERVTAIDADIAETTTTLAQLESL